MIPPASADWLEKQGYGEVAVLSYAGSGCINSGSRLQTSTGRTFFLKTNPQAPYDLFVREAQGLEALRIPGGPRLPRPFLAGQDFLLMEDLSPAPRRPDYWTVFGQRLAVLHKTISPQFGFPDDNHIGSTPQPNPWTQDGFEFFAEHRLRFQARLAHRRGLLCKADLERVDALADRLPQLIPVQPASLIHGDLWSGNAITDELGQPALIDPAAHYGWAEADLAMTTLFGSFPEAFYCAYREVYPLAPGFRERYSLYNLYHLLNHLNLFGTGYLGAVTDILRCYG
jgi:fructosamine-3-kinase